NLKLAKMADEVGLDFLLPIGRWKGYGGDTDYQGATLETITWATGILASTRRVTVFGTVHAPLFNPVIAAKEMVTADHIGEGRFGLNIVVGWNEGEFQMFGVKQRDQEGGRGLLALFHRRACGLAGGRRYSRAQEHHRAEHRHGEVPADPQRLCAGDGRSADRRRPRSCGEPAHRSEQGGVDRSRG